MTEQGAAIEGGTVARFHDLTVELQALRRGSILVDLSHYDLITTSGEDAEAFLHGQLSNDVRKLDGRNWQLNGYCTPKGRMLASFLLWKQADRYFMQLPATLREPIQKRLSMFVLRAKVKLADASDEFIRMGIAGPDAARLVRAACALEPPAERGLAQGDKATVLCLDADRFEVLATLEHAPSLWSALSENAVTVGAARWEWLAIRAGEPVIMPATQDQFVPQMVNFELVGGVNFQKGCYPGQEIVARTQYLGKLKRRMFRVSVPAETVAPGDPLFSADLEGQASGMIVNAAPSPDGGFDALAVIQMESAQSHPLHLKSLDGPALKLLPLPYAVA